MTSAYRLSATEARSLHQDLEAGLALPTEFYSDPAIFEAELASIHRKAWHFAAQTGELKAPGEVILRRVAGVEIILARGKDGEVRGFLNICRHRGHPVVLAEGEFNALRCHYHGWTYELDGRLRHAPRSDGDPGFDASCFGLAAVQTHVWGPMIWVNLDPAAPAFETWIEGLPERMALNGLDVTEHAFGFDHTWDMAAGWKVFQDNTIECYHCPTAHPELARVLEMKPERQEMHVGARYWIWHRIPFRPGIESGPTFQKRENEPLNYFYYWIFPTTYIQHAGRGFDVGSVDVIAPDRIRFRHLCFMPKGTPEEDLQKGFRQLAADPTIAQDVAICDRVQASHATGLAPRGRMLAGTEDLLVFYQHLIVEMLTERGPGTPAVVKETA